MFNKTFFFYSADSKEGCRVNASDLYSADKGYGFVTEENRNQDEFLKLPELNSAFDTWYWLAGQTVTELIDTPYGVSLKAGDGIPVIFKADLKKQGNYNVKITINGGTDGINDLYIFTGRRRMMVRGINIAPGESYVAEYTINICDIIPRGKTECYADTTLDIAIIADKPSIASVEIAEADVPTIFIAGDSTVTDQSGTYPYDPGCCYSGWAQIFPMLFKTGIAVSNHAHSGLTTESFRGEGHYAIVEKYIRPGDYYFMQFAHNDQKLPHLSAFGGYAENLRRYVAEIRAKGAIPVIVTPLARNTWKADGTYNDLLLEHSNACKAVAKELNVPLLDLHERSMELILELGLETSKLYYFPKDYTHSNDYGAYKMAHFVAKEILDNGPAKLADFVQLTGCEWAVPEKIVMPTPPAEFVENNTTAFETKFKDLNDNPYKAAITALTSKGIIPNEEAFRPNDIITRVEALSWIIKAVSFVPVNVYNDMYPDVIGHEWYAGVVESAYQNDIVNKALTADGKFHPLDEVTAEQMVSFCISAYKSRKKITVDIPSSHIADVSSYAVSSVDIAKALNLLPEDFAPQKVLTRAQASEYVKKISDNI